jgi:hypothetical protein
MQSDTREEPSSSPPERTKHPFWTGRVILGIILFLVFLLLLIHLPPVQQWGINKITKSIREKLDTRVSIGSFTLSPISDLTLRNIYIGSPGHPDDTLIYAQELNVDYLHIWDLFNNHFTISQVGVKEGTLNIHKLASDTLTNLDLALAKLLPARDTTKPGFALDLHQINAIGLRVNVDDESNGMLMRLLLSRADVELDTLDITNSHIAIKSLDLDEPRISVINRVVVIDSNRLVAKVSKTWFIDVDRWELTNGIISLENMAKPHITYKDPIGIDYSHLLLDDVDLTLDSLRVRGWAFTAKNVDIHALHHNGFEINTLAARQADISRNGVILEDLILNTDKSHIENSISLLFSGFTDFKSFADSVTMVIPKAKMKVQLHDLLALAPGLQNVDFFFQNADKDIQLQGDVNGHVNRLKILKMNAAMGGVKLIGDFRSHDLAVKGSQLLSLDLSNSTVSAASLKDIFPNMKIPAEFNRVGQVNFTGKFDGYPNDFVAFGTFNTSLGKVTLDLNLNTVEGIAKGAYSGKIALDNFDVGTLTGVKNLGRVTLSGRVIDGKGLTTATLLADVSGQLSMLEYKGYTYHNARVDGQLTGKLFNGTLDINDPNVDMHFEGIADFRDSLPKLDFVAKIDSIRFMELGLSKEPVYLEGYFDANFTAGKLSQTHGTLKGENIRLIAKGETYKLDSLAVLADVDTTTQDRFYKIESDVVSGIVRGSFDPVTLASQMQEYLAEQYPSSIDPPKKLSESHGQQRIAWDLSIHDSRNWFSLAEIQDLEIKNAHTTGSLDLDQKLTTGTLDLPELHYDGINVYGSTLSFKEDNGKSSMDLEVIAADLKENFFFEDVLIQGGVTNDSMNFRFKTDDLADIIDQIDMDINARTKDGKWSLSFSPRKLKMLDADWQIPSGNILEIGKKYLRIENFELVSGTQRIHLEDINNKGLKADIDGFDVSYLNDLWVNDKFKFSGLYTLDFEADNVFDVRSLRTTIKIPALRVNNIPYGEWLLNANMEDPKDSVRIDLSMHNNETRLTGTGAYLPPIKSIPKEAQNYLRLDLVTTDFPLDFLEFLLGGNIRDTEGSIDMTMSLTGKVNKLNPNGKGRVYNGSTTIDYLGAAYSFHDQAFTITPDMIDLTGAKLYDVMGNVAVVKGGITHRYLRNLGLNATISSDRILGLDVTSEENNVFYGTGIGAVYAQFSGTIANPVMQIQATTARGTHIYIPLTGAATASTHDFAAFLENGLLPANKTTQIKLGNIDMTMNMTITDDAIVELIFDENSGEVLRGSGTGNIAMHMTPTGNFTMYGKYYISTGDYLFTNFAIIKKPFELLPGGTIQWNGDPYDATIDIQAKYKGLTASVYTLIQEYLVNESADVINEARNRTDVDLTMTLTGSLLHPDIAFDISFPLLTGKLKAYTDSKINTLKANENAMLQQVVGLLIMRSFLPSNAGLNSQTLSSSIDATVTDLVSATLSSYLGGLLGNLIPQGKVLSGIDFQMAVDFSVTGQNPVDSKEAAVEIDLPLQFFNDRLEVNVGGNYVKGAAFVNASEYYAGDVSFGYYITPDKRLKIRAYNQNTLTVEGRKNKVGLGVAYKREYNNVGEIFGKKK